MTAPQDDLDGFLAELKDRNRSPFTLRTYRFVVRRYLAALDGTGPTAATTAQIRAYLAQFAAPANRYQHIAGLRAFYGYLASTGAIDTDPTRALRLPTLPERVPRVITREEEGAIFRAARDDPELLTILHLLRYSGLRIGGIVGYRRPMNAHLTGITLEQVRLDQRVVELRAKGGRRVEAFVTKPTAALLAAQLQRRQTASAGPSDPLFADEHGRPRGTEWVQRRFRELIVAAKVGRTITPHMLRHTFATRFLEESGNLRALQRLLHHRKMSSTLIYADYVDSQALRGEFDRFVGPDHPRVISRRRGYL